jgi:hypothetical protein
MLVLCSRNARPQKGLVRRSYIDQHEVPFQERESKHDWRDHYMDDGHSMPAVQNRHVYSFKPTLDQPMLSTAVHAT